MWKLWSKALGDTSGIHDAESDKVTCIRTGIVLVYMTTNALVIASILHHW